MNDHVLHRSCPSCSPENAFCFVTLDLTSPCVIVACCVASSRATASTCAVRDVFHTLSSLAQIRSSSCSVWMTAVSATSGPFLVTSSTVAMSESLHDNTSNHLFLQSHTPLRPQPNNNRRSERMLRYHVENCVDMTRQDGCERQDDL